MVNKKDIDDLKSDLKAYFDAGLKQQTDILSVKCDDMLRECREAHSRQDDRITTLEMESDNSKQLVASLQNKLEETEQKVTQMEAKLLECNLRFSNISHQGNAEDSVRHFFTHTLNLPEETVKNMQFVKCFTVGRPTTATDNKTIIVNFQKQSDVQAVKNAAYKKPKGTPGGVREDLPYTWASKRAELYKKIIQPAKQDKDINKPVKIKWIGAELELNGKKIDPKDSYTSVKKQLMSN